MLPTDLIVAQRKRHRPRLHFSDREAACRSEITKNAAARDLDDKSNFEKCNHALSVFDASETVWQTAGCMSTPPTAELFLFSLGKQSASECSLNVCEPIPGSFK